MTQEDYSRLQHELLMGDAYVCPENIGRIKLEMEWGASYQSLIDKGIIKLAIR